MDVLMTFLESVLLKSGISSSDHIDLYISDDILNIVMGKYTIQIQAYLQDSLIDKKYHYYKIGDLYILIDYNSFEKEDCQKLVDILLISIQKFNNKFLDSKGINFQEFNDKQGSNIIDTFVTTDNGVEILNLIVRLNKICNQNCEFCFVKLNNQIYDYNYIISQLEKNVGTYDRSRVKVILSGGEPSIHPKFWDIVDYIVSSGYGKVEVQTNAVNFSNEVYADNIIKYKDKLTFLVSFHSHIEEDYDKSTGSLGQFYKGLKGLKNISQRIKKDVEISRVFTKYNLNNLKEYIDFFIEQGITCKINLYSLSSSFRDLSHLQVKFSDIVDSINKVIGSSPDSIQLNYGGTGFSTCFMPMCIRRKIKNFDASNISTIDYNNSAGVKFSYIDECKNCKVRNNCYGLLDSYINKFGISEFKAIK